MRIAFALAVAMLSLTAAAGEPPVPLPRERPEAAANQPAVPPPHQRPAAEPDAPSVRDDRDETPDAPPRIYQTACPAVLAGRVEAEALPPIEEGQCRAQSPLALTGVLANGRMVPVSGGVRTDCGVATALPAWIGAVDAYVAAREGTRIAELLVGTSYMCRNVDNARAGNLSFHGLADALDIVGFRLEDGRTVTVEAGWADAVSPEGRLLRFAHGAACAQFTTVLGPEANAEHRDHLHVDLGCHGKSCTARLCQ